MSLAAVRDLRVARAPVTAEDLAALETDVLALVSTVVPPLREELSAAVP